MSNQSVNGFQGSQPFITDKEFQNLSLAEIRHIIEQEKEALKKDYSSEIEQRQRLIKQYKKLVELRNKVKQGIDIKKKYKKTKPKKIKRFLKILLNIYVKLLSVLCMNMKKELN